MLSTGFKYFFGLAIFALVATFVYGMSTGDVSGPDYFGFVDRRAIVGLISLGWVGGVGDALGFFVLLFLAAVSALVGVVVVSFRDGDPENLKRITMPTQFPQGLAVPPAQRPTAPDYWPFLAAVSVGVIILGLALEMKILWVGAIGIAVVCALEWAFSGWAERSTADAETNAALRHRLLAPIELPALAAVVVGVFALAISRVLLAVSKLGSVVALSVIAAVFMLVAILLSTKPNLSRKSVAIIVGAVVLAVVALGIVTAVIGPREIEHHASALAGGLIGMVETA